MTSTPTKPHSRGTAREPKQCTTEQEFERLGRRIDQILEELKEGMLNPPKPKPEENS